MLEVGVYHHGGRIKTALYTPEDYKMITKLQ